jgi:hypothetical protein
MSEPIYYSITDLEPDIWWVEVIDNKANRFVICKEYGSEKRQLCFTEKATEFFLKGAKKVNITESQFNALYNLATDPNG